ncbi:MAG: hypothetical protein AAFX01_02730 [Cyanobacteria bacterium J06638_28]
MLDADGDLATGLEAYSAEQLRRWSEQKLQGVSCSELAIDMFATEGQVNGQSVLDAFVATQPELSASDRALVKSWQDTFNGLFRVLQVTSEAYELINWLTEKRYWVRSNGLQSEDQLSRLAPDEIIVARLSPVTDGNWMFSGPLLLLGKLGKPKLAVAVGNFRNWFPDHLYGDAPDLLEEAWISVERYHNDFVQFFGAERVTLSGYELNKKLKAYQEVATQRELEKVGLDGSQSLQDLVDQAGVSKEEISEAAASFGEDGREVSRLLENSKTTKMKMPSINLPDEFQRAEAVTVFVHPRWGQTFLKDYQQLTQLLEATDEDATAKRDRLLQKYLKEEAVNVYVWRCFAEANPEALETALRRVLNRPDFSLPNDLDQVLAQSGKFLEPKLPEIASVPVHLHNLFQEALQEVDQGSSKKKSKGKAKRKKGFASL